MAKRSVGLPFSRLLLNRALKNPMGAAYHGFYPSARTPNPSLLGRPFCSTSTPTAVRHLLAKLEMEKHLKLMESVANFLPKYFCFILTVLLPDKLSVSFMLSRMEKLLLSFFISWPYMHCSAFWLSCYPFFGFTRNKKVVYFLIC